MARRKLAEDKKRVAISISVTQDVKALAESTENASRFFERSVNTCRGLKEILAHLGDKATKAQVAEALEDLEDLAAAWDAQFDETVPFEVPKKATKRGA